MGEVVSDLEQTVKELKEITPLQRIRYINENISKYANPDSDFIWNTICLQVGFLQQDLEALEKEEQFVKDKDSLGPYLREDHLECYHKRYSVIGCKDCPIFDSCSEKHDWDWKHRRKTTHG